MTILQSKWTQASGPVRTVPAGAVAGEVIAQKFDFVIAANLVAASDIIEIGVLPANHTIVDAVLITDEVGTVTWDVGIMSGDVGDTGTRTSGNELFAAAADASTVRMSAAGGFRIAPTDKDRSIGIKASANITASNQKVELLLLYKAATN
jgi:hypothetical protein